MPGACSTHAPGMCLPTGLPQLHSGMSLPGPLVSILPLFCSCTTPYHYLPTLLPTILPTTTYYSLYNTLPLHTQLPTTTHYSLQNTLPQPTKLPTTTYLPTYKQKQNKNSQKKYRSHRIVNFTILISVAKHISQPIAFSKP